MPQGKKHCANTRMPNVLAHSYVDTLTLHTLHENSNLISFTE